MQIIKEKIHIIYTNSKLLYQEFIRIRNTERPKLLEKNKIKFLLIIISFVLGIIIGAAGIFHILFLYRVLPHGGL